MRQMQSSSVTSTSSRLFVPLRLTERGAGMASPVSLSDRAYGAIREEILRGQLRPGTPLSRRRLAQELGMSVLPVTDALRRLEVDGLVESRARAGTRVRVPSARCGCPAPDRTRRRRAGDRIRGSGSAAPAGRRRGGPVGCVRPAGARTRHRCRPAARIRPAPPGTPSAVAGCTAVRRRAARRSPRPRTGARNHALPLNRTAGPGRRCSCSRRPPRAPTGRVCLSAGRDSQPARDLSDRYGRGRQW